MQIAASSSKNENILTICVIMANFSPLLIRQRKKKNNMKRILIIIFKACNYFIINKRSFGFTQAIVSQSP